MKILRSLTAWASLALLLVGAPSLLLQLGRLPGFLPSWGQWSMLLVSPDSGRLFLVVVWGAAWVLWLWLAIIVLVETVVAVRGVTPPTLPGGSFAQPLIRALVLSAIGALIAAPVPAAATPPAAPDAIATAPAAVDAVRDRDDAAAVPAAAGEVVVERGDTLWSLSEEHLDDPYRWPELFELNRGVEQPGGYSLQDPDAIDIGWRLALPVDDATLAAPEPSAEVPVEASPSSSEEIPETTPSPEAEPVDPPPSTTTPTVLAPSVPVGSPVPSAPAAVEEASRSELTASVGDAEPQTFPWQVAGLAGAGSFLGVGMATVLLARRREQFRTRRPGTTIADPGPEVAPIEKTAHLAVGLSARLVDRVHAVLRRLAGTVPVSCLIVARDGTMQILTDGRLEPPWIPEPGGWTLPNSVPVDQIGPDTPETPCAYPLLVTIGTDIDDRVVLINLETIGRLTLGGDDLMRDDFARYLAAELGLNPWSSGIRVSCHGPAADAIAIAPDRLDAPDSEILAIARRNLHRADTSQLPTHEGRATQAEDENWPAAVILIDTPHPSDVAELITGHPGKTGTAIVTLHDQEPILTLTPSGRVRGLGMELTAVGLTEHEAAGCATLLQVTDEEPLPPPPADEWTDATGNLLTEHRAPRDDLTAEPSLLPEPDETYLEETATTSEDLAVLAPRIPSPVVDELKNRDTSLDRDVELWFSDTCPYPRLSLLGPVTARCYGKPMAKQKAYYTEALAFLALHPNGVTGDQVAEAFGLTLQRARTVISNLRQWVGTNPRTQEPHIPDAKSSPQAQARGIGLYVTQDVLLDIDLFRRLHTRAVARGADGIADLETALRLVRGRPFEQLRPAGWSWLFEGDRIDHHMVSAIGDVAHILVTHHLHAGDHHAAKQAATTALAVDPDSEVARLDLAAIMVETGHSELAREALIEALGSGADLDLTPRGFDLANRKGWGS